MGKGREKCEKWVKMLQQGYVLENDSGCSTFQVGVQEGICEEGGIWVETGERERAGQGRSGGRAFQQREQALSVPTCGLPRREG